MSEERNYVVVYAEGTDRLEHDVCQKMENGYVPIGGVSSVLKAHGGRPEWSFFQAMIRKGVEQ